VGATGHRLVQWPRGALWTAVCKSDPRGLKQERRKKERNKKIEQGRDDPLMWGRGGRTLIVGEFPGCARSSFF